MKEVQRPFTTRFNIDKFEDAKSGFINDIEFKNGDQIKAISDRHEGEGNILIRWRDQKWVFLVADFYFNTKPIHDFKTIIKLTH